MTVIPFTQAAERAAHRPARQGGEIDVGAGAQILFFTGVRIERHGEAGPTPQPVSPRRRRLPARPSRKA